MLSSRVMALHHVMCLSIGTPKIIIFSFVPNGKLIIFRYPSIWAYYSLIIMFLNTGTSKNCHFPFGTNGEVVVLGVPILKHFRVHWWMFCPYVIGNKYFCRYMYIYN